MLSPGDVSLLQDTFRLHRACTRRYSFNNLNALLNGPPELSGRAIKQALDKYGGGYCHELNLHFASELSGIGVEVEPRLGEVHYGQTEGSRSRSHLFLVARVGTGEILCDTAFGVGPLWPVRLDRAPAVSRQHRLSFRVVREGGKDRLDLQEKGRWVCLYRYGAAVASREEIEAANRYSALSPESIVSSSVVATKYVYGGRRVLLNTVYQDRAVGLSIRLQSASMLRDCLHSKFGVALTRQEARAAYSTARCADNLPVLATN